MPRSHSILSFTVHGGEDHLNSLDCSYVAVTVWGSRQSLSPSVTWFISKEKNNDTLDILSGDHIREERWVAWKNPSKNWYILYKHITGHKSTTYRPQQPHTDHTPTTYCTYPIPTAYWLDQLVHYYSIDCPRISHFNYSLWLDQWCYDWFILYIFCFLGYRHCHTGVRSFLLFHQGVSAVQSSEIMINRIIIINTVVIFSWSSYQFCCHCFFIAHHHSHGCCA